MAKTVEKKFNVQIDSGTYWARIVVPKDVRDIIGRREYLENLGRVDTTPYDVAVAKCCEYKLEWRENIKAARAGTYVAPDAPLPPFELERMAYATDPEAVARYLTRYGIDPNGLLKTTKDAPVTFESMIAEWISKKRITNDDTIGKVTGQFERFAAFLKHNDGKNAARRIG